MSGASAQPEQQYLRLLSCVALSPEFRGLLLLDARQEALERVVADLSGRLAAVRGRPVHPVVLTAGTSEDLLWGRYVPSGTDGRASLSWRPGLVARDAPEDVRLLVVPDLARLPPIEARSYVQLVDAGFVHLERHGRSEVWSLGTFWLACCATHELRRVSPHLLERFPLRLSGAGLPAPDRRQGLLEHLRSDHPLGWLTTRELPDDEVRGLRQAAHRRPLLSDAAARAVLEFLPVAEGHRRELAVARLARAEACLRGDPEIAPEHVTAAAEMLGLDLAPVPPVETPAANPEAQPPTSGDKAGLSHRGEDAPVILSPSNTAGATGRAGIQAITSEAQSTGAQVPLKGARQDTSTPNETSAGDEAPLEAMRLRPPAPRSSASRVLHGQVIGIQGARDLRDLSVVSTLLEAAKYQRIRQGSSPGVSGSQVWPADLRGYRRAPPPDHLLVVVLDHTCLTGWNWRGALAPYLRSAYVDRAAICLIQVGAGDTRPDEELRARRIFGRNLLVPALARGFESGRGSTTPLAHGLELALETLRRAIHHQKSPASQLKLVVLSDGRGNVPLEASHAGRLVRRVGAEGVEDALRVAADIREIKGVSVEFIDPRPRHHPELPRKLASALGARLRVRSDVPQVASLADEDG